KGCAKPSSGTRPDTARSNLGRGPAVTRSTPRMTDLRRFSSLDGLLAIALFLTLVVGLVVVPRLVPADAGVVSAAAARGFNTDAAFWTLLAWAALTLSVFGLRGMSRRGANETAVEPN